MCPILDGYGVMGIFNPRKRPHVNRISWNQLAGDVLNLVAFLLRCQHYFRHLLAQFTTKRQPVLRPAVAFTKTSFKHRSTELYIYTLNVSCIMVVYYFVPFIVNNRYLLF